MKWWLWRAVAVSGAALVLSARIGWAHDSGFGLARYTPRGVLDTSFGTNGIVVTRSAQRSFVANALALQTDGRILIGGMVSDLDTGSIQLAVARYTADGRADSDFGTDGVASTPFGPAGALANAILLQPDGKILVAGIAFSHGDSEDQFVIARFTSTGQPDASFGGGIVTTPAGAGGSSAQALALQTDGKIVVVGTAFANGATEDDFALVRYTHDGNLDPEFGAANRGIVTTDFGGGDPNVGASLDRAGAVALQPDGRIVVAGISRGDHQAFSIARYARDGSLDTTFGAGGKTQVQATDPQVFSLILDPSGDVVVAGSSGSSAGGTAPFAVVRLHSDGVPDPRFGVDGAGVATVSFEGSRSGARAVAVQSDGKLLAAGAKYGAPSSQGDALAQSGFAIARYTGDGNVDTSFGSGGRVVTELGDAGAMPLSLVVQPDGKIVAAGLVFFRVVSPADGNPLGAVQSVAVPLAVVGLVLVTVSIARVVRRRRKGN